MIKDKTPAKIKPPVNTTYPINPTLSTIQSFGMNNAIPKPIPISITPTMMFGLTNFLQKE